MEYKIYKAKFWRDRIWILLFPGIFGLLTVSFWRSCDRCRGLSVAERRISFWVFIGVLLFFDLPCVLVGGILFYLLPAGIKTKIIITDEFLIYDAPLYKKRVFIQDIRAIAFEKTSSNINLFK